MHCEQCETLLPLLVFDEIEDGDKTQVLEHLSHCGSCSEKLGDLRVTFNLLREGINTAPAPVLSADRRNRLLATLAKEPVRSKRKSKKAVAKKRTGIFNLFNIGTPAQRLLAIAATLAFSAALATVLLPSLGSARRTSRIVADQNAKRAEEAVALSRADASRYDDQLATKYEPRVMELGERNDNGRPPAENSYLQQFSRDADSDDSSRLAYSDRDRSFGSFGSGGGGRASGRSVESASYNSPVPPPVVRLSGQGEGRAKDGEKSIAMTGDDVSEQLGIQDRIVRFGREAPSTGQPMAQGLGNKTDSYKNQWFEHAGRRDGAASDPFAPATPSPETAGTAKPGGRTVPPPVLAVAPPRSERFDAPADETAIPPRGERLRSETETRWNAVPAAPAGPTSGPSSVTAGIAVQPAKPGRPGTDSGLLPATDDKPVLPLEPRPLKREQEEIHKEKQDQLERLADSRDGQTYEFRRDAQRNEDNPQSEGVLEQRMQSMKKLADLEKSIDEQPLIRGSVEEFKYQQKEPLQSQTRQAEGKDDGEVPANGSVTGKATFGLDLSDALGERNAPPGSTTPLVRSPEQGQTELFDRTVLGGTTRRVPDFSAAPEFDLNAGLDNSKKSGGKQGGVKGGEQASGTTLFGDGKAATTLFSESDEDDEQATREEKIEQITTLIQDNVGKQHTWAAYGGEVSSLREIDGKLIIKGTATQHRQTTDLLNKLRTDQTGRPLYKLQVPGETEADRALTQRLQQRISLNLEGKKLEEAVRELEEKTGGNLVVNWQALEAAGVERDLSVNLRLKEVPAETALKVMLTQAGAGAELEPIDYEVVNGIVNISTRRDLDRNTVTQVYDVRDLLNQPLNAKDSEALARQLKEAEAREKEQLAKQAEEARQAAEKASAEAAKEQQAQLQQADEGQLQPAASFRVVPVNPWTLAQEDAQSTFALDVDTASYTLGRRYLERGFLPPQGSVRMEEYVNAFDYNYVNNSDQVFRVFSSAAPAPFANAGEPGIKLVKIGVKGKVIGRDGRKPANLVLVVDTSGSMARPDRLPLVQHSLELLTEQLSPQDTVSLVTFGSQVLTLLDRTPASNKQQIIAAIRSLQSNGPTNLLKGVEAGYRLAVTAHKAGAINRVILCSDGIATLGETEADTILGYVENYRKQGISCTTVGVGAGAYDDDMMEKLANKGDGMYYFIDSPREAKRVFVDEITATLQTIAKDAKIQVEFDPQRVRRYRLIGYENRAVADKDFRNDTIDAGEVGSGQSSTALYEVELIGDERADLGTVYVRYRNTDTNKIEEISHRLTTALVQDRSPQSDPRFFLAACAAEFAEVLRGSEHATGGNLAQVQTMLEKTVPHLPLDEKAQELLNLVRKAQGLPSAP